MTSKDSSLPNFGLLIAYILPGFTALQGFPFTGHLPTVWIASQGEPNSSLTSFLSETAMALTAGLTVSIVRWLLVDRLHHRTGVRPPPWDFSRLTESVAAFEYLVQVHYWYYKFYANMVVALVWAYGTRGYSLGLRGLTYWALIALFFLASRDALTRYYTRTGELLGRQPQA